MISDMPLLVGRISQRHTISDPSPNAGARRGTAGCGRDGLRRLESARCRESGASFKICVHGSWVGSWVGSRDKGAEYLDQDIIRATAEVSRTKCVKRLCH